MMNPIRAYQGERRQHYRAILVTFWAILIVAVIVSTGALIVAYHSRHTAEVSEKAICIEQKYLNGAGRLGIKVAQKTRDPVLRQQRVHSAKGALKLANDIKALDIHCD